MAAAWLHYYNTETGTGFPSNYDFPTSKEGQVVHSQSGRKEEKEESGRMEGERGSEESAAICGNKREFLI